MMTCFACWYRPLHVLVPSADRLSLRSTTDGIEAWWALYSRSVSTVCDTDTGTVCQLPQPIVTPRFVMSATGVHSMGAAPSDCNVDIECGRVSHQAELKQDILLRRLTSSLLRIYSTCRCDHAVH